MTDASNANAGQVTFQDRVRGEVWPEMIAASGTSATTRVRLEDGRQVLVPTTQMVPQGDGTYAVALRADELPFAHGPGGAPRDGADETVIVPIVAESLEVHKREVETGRVRLTKTVEEHTEVVDEPLWRKTVEVRRVPINREVSEAPPVRYEGETMIVPVLEEVMVMEKRLFLREEVHLVPQRTEVHDAQQITLRREQVTVERLEPPPTR